MTFYYITRVVTLSEEYKIECDADDEAGILEVLWDQMDKGLECYSSDVLRHEIIQIAYEDEHDQWQQIELDEYERVEN